ncbi:MAG: hypothetical protein Q8R14_02965 [Candidatus Omnitrophota bacterium]|nr:hypothetical protein [Candidatus Omnitrophota bacterium]
MRIILLTCILSIGLVFNSYASQDKDLNDFYMKLKDIKKPIEIYDADMFRDGGTIFVTLAGSKNEELTFCMNGKMGSPTMGSLYVNASLARTKGAIKVPAASPLEGLILDVLKEWLTQDIDEAAYDEQWQKRQKMKGYNNVPLKILEAHKRWVKMLIADVEEHRSSVLAVQASGPFTRERAIDLAKHLSISAGEIYENIKATETPDSYTVTFVGMPFQDDGIDKKSDMNVIISKETGKIVEEHASNVR